MKITGISLSVFNIPGNTGKFDLTLEERGGDRYWHRQDRGQGDSEIHVLHVHTDEGIEGVCTVGDARLTTMRKRDLEQLRILSIGEDAFDRERLFNKMREATRGMFARQGWFGAFDNCLWDIAGKAAGLAVSALIGRARTRCPVYANTAGSGVNHVEAVMSSLAKAEMGFTALKDHFRGTPRQNITSCTAVREAVGPNVELLHDAVLSRYTYNDALRVGQALWELDYRWMEEPLQDANLNENIKLCAALDLPILTLETMMNDLDLSAQWLIHGAADLVRANARHGTTATLKLAHMAELHGTNVELNGPGGLFGLVHAHLVCAIRNTSYYEYFPGGSRDEKGKEFGLMNPPVPANGYISPPDGPGWGAEWDWQYFKKVRTAVL